jgi:hypothetical protein
VAKVQWTHSYHFSLAALKKWENIKQNEKIKFGRNKETQVEENYTETPRSVILV